MPWRSLAAFMAAIPPAVLASFLIFLPVFPFISALAVIYDAKLTEYFFAECFLATFFAAFFYSFCIRFLRGLIPHQIHLRKLFPQRFFCKSLKVWVVPGDTIQAYAIGGKRGAVVITESTYKLPQPLIEWIVEHEKSHLRHRDTSTFLWTYSAEKTIETAYRIAYRVTFLHRKIPIIKQLLSIYFYLAISTTRFFLKVHWFFRRRADWQMEYRSDKEASLNTSPKLGILVLNLVFNQRQPGIDIATRLGISSHPPLAKRIQKLENLS